MLKLIVHRVKLIVDLCNCSCVSHAWAGYQESADYELLYPMTKRLCKHHLACTIPAVTLKPWRLLKIQDQFRIEWDQIFTLVASCDCPDLGRSGGLWRLDPIQVPQVGGFNNVVNQLSNSPGKPCPVPGVFLGYTDDHVLLPCYDISAWYIRYIRLLL
jgi:hypothetical protein